MVGSTLAALLRTHHGVPHSTLSLLRVHTGWLALPPLVAVWHNPRWRYQFLRAMAVLAAALLVLEVFQIFNLGTVDAVLGRPPRPLAACRAGL